MASYLCTAYLFQQNYTNSGKSNVQGQEMNVKLLNKYTQPNISPTNSVSLSNCQDQISSQYHIKKDSLFSFDPNSLSAEEAQLLHIPNKVYKNIRSYLSKGGCFYKSEQLQKIYGLQPELYLKLKPFISIPIKHISIKKTNSIPSRAQLDINLISAIQLSKEFNLDKQISNRIVNYRNKLGGYYSLYQLKEVYGLEDSSFLELQSRLQIIEPYRKLFINSIATDSLSSHPYVGKKRGQLIISYLRIHGKVNKAEDLKLIYSDDANSLEKLIPYLDYK